jgi:carbonic anhydrase
MLTFSNDDLRTKLRDEAQADASGIDFLPFDDLEMSVREDVDRIRTSPFIDPAIPVSGWIYDVKNGQLKEVVAVEA